MATRNRVAIIERSDRASAPFGPVSLVEHHHHLVGPHDVEIAAQQFPGKIGVYMVLIEQAHPVLQVIASDAKLRQFCVALFQHMLVLGPGDQPAGSGDYERPHQQEQSERNTLNQTFPGKAGVLTHDGRVGPHEKR